jgi:hypothetical protein
MDEKVARDRLPRPLEEALIASGADTTRMRMQDVKPYQIPLKDSYKSLFDPSTQK